jgi:hypothetical protein
MNQGHHTPGVVGVEVAAVRPEPHGRERKTKHTWAGAPMAWPAVLIIEASPTDAMLYRYSATRELGGDTWHQSTVDAKVQAAFEYGDLVSEWLTVLPDEDPFEFAIRHRGA